MENPAVRNLQETFDFEAQFRHVHADVSEEDVEIETDPILKERINHFQKRFERHSQRPPRPSAPGAHQHWKRSSTIHNIRTVRTKTFLRDVSHGIRNFWSKQSTGRGYSGANSDPSKLHDASASAMSRSSTVSKREFFKLSPLDCMRKKNHLQPELRVEESCHTGRERMEDGDNHAGLDPQSDPQSDSDVTEAESRRNNSAVIQPQVMAECPSSKTAQREVLRTNAESRASDLQTCLQMADVHSNGPSDNSNNAVESLQADTAHNKIEAVLHKESPPGPMPRKTSEFPLNVSDLIRHYNSADSKRANKELRNEQLAPSLKAKESFSINSVRELFENPTDAPQKPALNIGTSDYNRKSQLRTHSDELHGTPQDEIYAHEPKSTMQNSASFKRFSSPATYVTPITTSMLTYAERDEKFSNLRATAEDIPLKTTATGAKKCTLDGSAFTDLWVQHEIYETNKRNKAKTPPSVTVQCHNKQSSKDQKKSSNGRNTEGWLCLDSCDVEEVFETVDLSPITTTSEAIWSDAVESTRGCNFQNNNKKGLDSLSKTGPATTVLPETPRSTSPVMIQADESSRNRTSYGYSPPDDSRNRMRSRSRRYTLTATSWFPERVCHDGERSRSRLDVWRNAISADDY